VIPDVTLNARFVKALSEGNEPEPSFLEGLIAAINMLFSDHPKCLHLIFIY